MPVSVVLLVGAVLVVVAFGLAAMVLWLRARFVVVIVEGGSMAPSLAPADRVIVRRRPPGSLRVGQVAVVERPHLENGVWRWPPQRCWIIKRIAAVPGDPAPAFLAALGPRVPEGCLVLLGDNAGASVDSRRIGYFPVDRVLGIRA